MISTIHQNSSSKQMLVFSRFYDPHLGGVETHAAKVNQYLQKKGWQITVLTEKYDPQLKDEEMLDGIRVIRLAYPKIKLIGLVWLWGQIFKNLKFKINNFQTVIIHDVFIWYLPFRCLFPQVKVITALHGWEGIFPIPWKNIFLKRLAHRLTDKTIAVGQYIEQYYGVKADAITYGGIDQAFIQSAKHQHLAKKRSIITIVYLGRLEPDTGLELILKAMESLKQAKKTDKKSKNDQERLGGLNYRLLFLGDGSLHRRCEQYGQVLGFVDPQVAMPASDICLASGYLSIMQGLARANLVLSIAQHQLRADYLKQSPFQDYLHICQSPAEIAAKIIWYGKMMKNDRFLQELNQQNQKIRQWLAKQTWQKVGKLYFS